MESAISALRDALLGAALSWIYPAYIYLRNKYVYIGSPGITFKVSPSRRPSSEAFRYKVFIEVRNQREGPILLKSGFYVFSKTGFIKGDANLRQEHGTKRVVVEFYSDETRMHTLSDVYLRVGETAQLWVGVDPSHTDNDIAKAHQSSGIGVLDFQMTQWDEVGKPSMRKVRFKF